MQGNSGFSLVQEHGWRAGLKNLMRAEFRRWWKTSTWWKQTIIWVAMINLILFAIISEMNASGEGLPEVFEITLLYTVFGGMFVAVGVVIMMQSAIVGEKINGTAAWVLSKPVSRTAFVVSKLIPNMIGAFFTAILIPGLVAYYQISRVAQVEISFINFLGGIGILTLFNFYWVALTLMLGAFFNRRGAVIGIPLVLILGQEFVTAMIIRYASWLEYLIPYELAIPLGNEVQVSTAIEIINGVSPSNMIPFYSAVILIVVFTTIGIWRFSREEF
jgi:ABC-2 type transport system permease protein